MKRLLVTLFVFSVPVLALPLGQGAPEPFVETRTSSADKDFVAFETLINVVPPAFAALDAVIKVAPSALPKQLGVEEYFIWRDAEARRIQAMGLAFYVKYPTDSRRWKVVEGLVANAPIYVKAFGPEAETQGLEGASFDEEAKAGWEKKSGELQRALIASSDATLFQKGDADWWLFGKEFRAVTAARNRGEAHDYGVFRERFAAHAAKYGDQPMLAVRADDYLGALEREMPGSSLAEWRLYVASPNTALSKTAVRKIKLLEAMAKPLEIAFTAVDGRAVDLAKLRGKVVLIDFWATWCGPCKEEIPSVKKVYAAYHDRGFEVVGISLDQAGDRQKLVDYCREHDIPWPQYYDGKFWKNDYAVKYSIRSIPGTFLLDQSGRIVATDARGPKLESEVKRLLKL